MGLGFIFSLSEVVGSWARMATELLIKSLIPSSTTRLEAPSKVVELRRVDTNDCKNKERPNEEFDVLTKFLWQSFFYFGPILLATYLQRNMLSQVNDDLNDKPDPEVKKKLKEILQKRADAVADKANKPRETVECPKLNRFELRMAKNIIDPKNIDATFDHIGGLERTKAGIYRNAVLPFQFQEMYRGRSSTCPMGVLLYGPPGTGKTLLAKAIANKADAVFIEISVSGILSKFYGESNKLVAAAFSLAYKLAPAVLFVDEIDTILSRNLSGNDRYVEQIKSEFLSRWDGMTTQSASKILVLGASNNPHHLGKAIERRLPLRYHVGMPDVNARLEILKILVKKEDASQEAKDFLPQLAGMTAGYSGSDLKEVVRRAANSFDNATETNIVHPDRAKRITNVAFRQMGRAELEQALVDIRNDSQIYQEYARQAARGTYN